MSEMALFQAVSSRDVDEQAALLGGWQQHYAQMSAGTFSGEFAEARFEGAHLFVESTSQELFQDGALPADVVAVGVPLEMPGDAVFCGASDSASAVHAFSGEGGFEFCSPAGMVMGGMVVPRRMLLERLSAEDQAALCAVLNRPRLLASRADGLSAARGFVRGVFQMLGNAPDLIANQPLRNALREATLSNLTDLLLGDTPVTPLRIAPSRRWQVVAAAREYVLAHPEHPTSVADLCLATGTSRRSLQYCFQDVLHVSPVAFLRALRLNGVRSMLREAGSVSEAAAHWGFWHFGRFAQDYRALFGELPSETFRRHRGLNSGRH